MNLKLVLFKNKIKYDLILKIIYEIFHKKKCQSNKQKLNLKHNKQ